MINKLLNNKLKVITIVIIIALCSSLAYTINKMNKINKELMLKDDELFEMYDKYDILEASIEDNTTNTSNNTDEENNNTTAPVATENEYIFENGNYIAGKDFASGTFDVTVLSGGGNVEFDNNSIAMGLDTADGFFQSEYKNLTLESGQELKVINVKIKLIRK